MLHDISLEPGTNQKIDLVYLKNNLNLKKVDTLKFPTIKLLKNLPKYNSLYETVLITVNDFLVYKFLRNEINFQELIDLIIKIVNRKEFLKTEIELLKFPFKISRIVAIFSK